MKKILFIFGTRPEAIKLAPVIKVMQAQPEAFDVRVCVTAQHRQMLDQVLALFEITPHHDLNIMKPGQTLFEITQRALVGLERVLVEEAPDVVIAQGDTTTVFCAALAAFYLKIAFGHVEAGLRTHDKTSPFPEEINRQLATRIADWHFAPTARSKENLLKEGIAADRIFVTGNTVIDALLYVKARSLRVLEARSQNTALKNEEFDSKPPRLILLTAHRRENFGAGMDSICQAVLRILADNPDVEVVYPVHLNPHVQDPVNRFLAGNPRVKLIEPLDYLPFVELMAKSTLILTDSGGVQEEAPSLGKPVLVLRNTTERPEAVEAGTVKLVGTDFDTIVREANTLLQDSIAYESMARAHNPYGDGKASERIVAILLKQAILKRSSFSCRQ